MGQTYDKRYFHQVMGKLLYTFSIVGRDGSAYMMYVAKTTPEM